MIKRFVAAVFFVGMSVFSAQGVLAQDATVGTTVLPEVDVEAASPTSAFETKIDQFDQARDDQLMPKLGATSYSMDYQTLTALPQGTATPIDKVLLQAPGVSYDSAVSNPDFHIRNEYANVQYRINGILLPDGVSGLGPVLETGFIGNLKSFDRRASRTIWTSHRRRRRYDDTQRIHSRRQSDPLRRQFRHGVAEFRLRRQRRQYAIFRDWPLYAQR